MKREAARIKKEKTGMAEDKAGMAWNCYRIGKGEPERGCK